MIRVWKIPSWIGLLGLFWMGLGLARPLSPEEASSERIRAVLDLLAATPSGQALLKRADDRLGLNISSDFLNHLQWGESSRTDAVIIRHFNPKTGKERRERKVTIYLKKEQRLDDLVLDLAHELVHATTRLEWDPYDPDLTPALYIRAAIEGEGGEVDAVIRECEVGYELAAAFPRLGRSGSRCSSYRKTDTGKLDRAGVLRDFYRVGGWSGEFINKLGKGALVFPWLSSEKPRFYSSTGLTPYPVALLREYDGITEIACENSRKRLAHRDSLADPISGAFLERRCGRAPRP